MCMWCWVRARRRYNSLREQTKARAVAGGAEDAGVSLRLLREGTSGMSRESIMLALQGRNGFAATFKPAPPEQRIRIPRD